jgi:hypothetical protein
MVADNIPTKECPNKCQICQDTMSDAQEFYDFRAFTGNWYGSWCDGCVSCWRAHGVGLGIGKGQRYERQEDAYFVQTAGGRFTGGG